VAIKLHTCGNTFVHGPHPCWQVMKALNEAGIEYEQVKEPTFGRSRRTWVIEHTNQDRLPVIEFEDGSALREESKDMVTKIRAGQLRSQAAPS
jgi:hypothetical protein